MFTRLVVNTMGRRTIKNHNRNRPHGLMNQYSCFSVLLVQRGFKILSAKWMEVIVTGTAQRNEGLEHAWGATRCECRTDSVFSDHVVSWAISSDLARLTTVGHNCWCNSFMGWRFSYIWLTSHEWISWPTSLERRCRRLPNRQTRLH